MIQWPYLGNDGLPEALDQRNRKLSARSTTLEKTKIP